MAGADGWSGLFSTAFRQSSNGMVLVDARRLQVDANGAYLKLLGYTRRAVIGTPVYAFVADGPLNSPQEWDAAMASGRFTGETDLVHANGARISVQWGASVEVVTGRRLVLFVALSTSRWGRRFRRALPSETEPQALTRANARSCCWWRTAAAAPRSRTSCTSPTTPSARTCATR